MDLGTLWVTGPEKDLNKSPTDRAPSTPGAEQCTHRNISIMAKTHCHALSQFLGDTYSSSLFDSEKTCHTVRFAWRKNKPLEAVRWHEKDSHLTDLMFIERFLCVTHFSSIPLYVSTLPFFLFYNTVHLSLEDSCLLFPLFLNSHNSQKLEQKNYLSSGLLVVFLTKWNSTRWLPCPIYSLVHGETSFMDTHI